MDTSIVDVAGLIAGETTTLRGSQCATCAWLRGRPDAEREAWAIEMEKHTDDVQHAAVHRAMRAASASTGYRAPPSVGSVRKHRADGHRP